MKPVLRSIKKLWLSNNALTAIPSTIGQLSSLELLSLSKNALTTLPSTIGQLTSLQRLELADNCLTSLPSTIHQLVSLNVLDIRSQRGGARFDPATTSALNRLEADSKQSGLPRERIRLQVQRR
jgi:Leucine-rich repeat (LRR) protein